MSDGEVKVYVTVHALLRQGPDGKPQMTDGRRAQAWLQLPRDAPYADEVARYEVVARPEEDGSVVLEARRLT